MTSEWRQRIGNGPAISGKALPTRTDTGTQWNRMKRWEQEHDATRALHKSGVKVSNLAEAPEKLRKLGG
jgi:hypothetical protein